MHLLLTRTAIGRAMRAVSENQQLAALAGVDVRQIIRIVWLLGAALAAVAGVMAGLLVQIRPHMGHDLLLPLFAAAILGGIGSVPGAMLAGLIVGPGRGAVRAVHRRRMARGGRLRHPRRRAAAAPAGPVREAGMIELISYGAFFLTVALTYAIICLGLNVQWGQTGLFNVGVAGFVAIGAYASALLTTPDDPGASAASACRSSWAGWARAAAAASSRCWSGCSPSGSGPTIWPSPPSASRSSCSSARSTSSR